MNGVEEIVSAIDCVYYEISDTLNVIASGEDGTTVTLVFGGLPWPGSFTATSIALASSDSGTVAITAQFGAGVQAQTASSGVVYYDDSNGEAFEVSGAMFGDMPLAGEFTCDGLRVE